ncbi:MAG TPA: chloride channel protein [Rhizomicrobium sp.]|nr:chloride channel protein [Rhizomicrobium sp.]
MPTALSSLTRRTRQFWSIAQRHARSSEPAQIVACGISGAVIGALIALLHRFVDQLHRIMFNLPAGYMLSTGIGVDLARVLFVPLIGGLLLGVGALATRWFGARDVIDPIEANALHGGRMSLAGSMRLVGATVVSNGAGAAVGMEAGYSQFGASLLSWFGERLSLRRADQRIFVGAGAAAAIAAAFNAPLAGAFYGFELIIGTYMTRALAPVAAAVLAGTMAERAVVNPEPLFVIGQAFHLKQSVYLLFALLGIFSAGFSILAMQSVTWVERGFRRVPLPQWLRPAIGGICLAMLAIFFPQVLGGGHGAIQYLFSHPWPTSLVFLVLITKLLASAVSIGSGYRGGMFSSSLFLGCLFGAAFGDVASALVPRLAALHAPLMMVGMGSVAASVIGAPLTMIFLVLEGTGDLPMTIGVMTGVIISSSLVRLLFGYSFSTWRFHQRGMDIRSPHDIGWISDLTVAKLMRNDPIIVDGKMLLADLRGQYPPETAKTLFVQKDGSFVGTIDVLSLHAGRPQPDAGAVTAGDIAKSPGSFLLPAQNIRSALMIFDGAEQERLPVLDSPADRRIIGFLSEPYILKRYNQALERLREHEGDRRDLFPISEPPGN